MKRKDALKILFALALLGLGSCNNEPEDLLFEDFESGNYANWTVEGDAFGSSPASGSYTGQQPVVGFDKKFFANSFNNGDDSRGTLTSKPFVIQRDYLNFLIGGGTKPDTYIELLINGKQVLKSHSPYETETLERLSWNVKAYRGKEAILRIVDNQRGAWGHLLIDQIEQSNMPKSIFFTNHMYNRYVQKRYLLIPIEDAAGEVDVQLSVKDAKQQFTPIGEPLKIRLAQKNIDYWVPFDLQAYQGKQIQVSFSLINSKDIGWSSLKQEDAFKFSFDEKYRPLYHFSPPYGWMNDPNGMVYDQGTYHLFYQYNPYGTRWGNMHWGHAVSKDLTHWDNSPVALAPDHLGAIYSGSAVVDHENSAGLGKGAMVAIFTSAGERQAQSLAYSTDGGKTFTKYEGNPILSDPAITDFRDPKVFWYPPTKQWIMSLATSQSITFYGSKNLKQWTRLSEFGEGIGNHQGVWECPDLFPLTYEGKNIWVLLVSINPGGPNGGSATQYFLGDFDGKTFSPLPLPYPLWIDYGRDNYAGVSFGNIPNSDGRRIFVGWMSNWDYGNEVPTKHFRSAMTLPRNLHLTHNGKHPIVASWPIKETESLRTETAELKEQNGIRDFSYERLLKNNQGAYELSFTLSPNNSNRFSFALENNQGEFIEYQFDLANSTLKVDRSKSSVAFSANFAEKHIEAPLVAKKNYTIHLWVDKASVELFVNDGELSLTNIVFPNEVYNSLHFKADNGSLNIRGGKVYKLSKITP